MPLGMALNFLLLLLISQVKNLFPYISISLIITEPEHFS